MSLSTSEAVQSIAITTAGDLPWVGHRRSGPSARQSQAKTQKGPESVNAYRCEVSLGLRLPYTVPSTIIDVYWRGGLFDSLFILWLGFQFRSQIDALPLCRRLLRLPFCIHHSSPWLLTVLFYWFIQGRIPLGSSVWRIRPSASCIPVRFRSGNFC